MCRLVFTARAAACATAYASCCSWCCRRCSCRAWRPPKTSVSTQTPMRMPAQQGAGDPRMKFVLYANTDWYLYNFRLSTAQELVAHGHEVVMLSPPGEFGERFAAHGLRWITLDMDRASLNPMSELMTVRR